MRTRRDGERGGAGRGAGTSHGPARGRRDEEVFQALGPVHGERRLTRRHLLGAGLAGLAGLALAGRGAGAAEGPTPGEAGVGGELGRWRLTARPGARRGAPKEGQDASRPGLVPLGLGRGRDGLLHVPSGYRPDRPAPLMVFLHGAHGSARSALAPLQPVTGEAGIVLLVVDSRGGTWDMIASRRFGPDVAFLDRALGLAFERCAIDPARVALAGFSDGASYALSLGLANGDLFPHLIAFSPGFSAPPERRGKPRIYVSHGTRDTILPIETCSRRIVPRLQDQAYDVLYREFDGPHGLTPQVLDEAVARLVQIRS